MTIPDGATSSAHLKARLRHTWPAFFARHGNFTPVQLQAMPPILAGDNVLVISATASGKTEAGIVPLLERHCLGQNRLVPGDEPQLRILYICPTRALVRDLYERLHEPLERLHISLSMKSGDTGPVSTLRPPVVLITTPESTDSLLTRAPRLLGDLRAVVLDEIHLFDGGPRGDHLRCLLPRMERVRRYRSQELAVEYAPMQRIALSATVPDPQGIAWRYLTPDAASPRIVTLPGARQIDAEIWPLHDLADLVTALAVRAGSEQATRKSLLFCNTRAEVEQVAAYLRSHLPYETEVFTHYSNLDPALRLDVEQRFAAAGVALCVSTSTLELGIDIGSVDDVALLGAPPDMTSFLQRIGRGGRRTDVTRVLCLARTPLEEVHFRAMLALATNPDDPESGLGDIPPARVDFLPSVLVQQSFSLLKQSPTGALRLADLRNVTPTEAQNELDDEALRQIVGELVGRGYLRSGRLGEWRPAPKLDELADAHEIYSNIGGDPLLQQLVDVYSGRVLAQTGQRLYVGDRLRLGGRTLVVRWRDRYRIGVEPAPGGPTDVDLRVTSSPLAIPLEVSQAVARLYRVPPARLVSLPVAEGSWLFHFWGDVYGQLLAALLRPLFPPRGDAAPVTVINAHCLFLPGVPGQLPAYRPEGTLSALYGLLPRIEPYLELGRFHSLLPPRIAEQTVINRCDLPRFAVLYARAQVVPGSGKLRQELEGLL
ncbi:MAG: DEAD/DEAH box helicase [Caldilineaceae bacterium]|nr:DEAD/DEAH box helicase [Caldilineaceae bacterium]